MEVPRRRAVARSSGAVRAGLETSRCPGSQPQHDPHPCRKSRILRQPVSQGFSPISAGPAPRWSVNREKPGHPTVPRIRPPIRAAPSRSRPGTAGPPTRVRTADPCQNRRYPHRITCGCRTHRGGRRARSSAGSPSRPTASPAETPSSPVAIHHRMTRSAHRSGRAAAHRRAARPSSRCPLHQASSPAARAQSRQSAAAPAGPQVGSSRGRSSQVPQRPASTACGPTSDAPSHGAVPSRTERSRRRWSRSMTADATARSLATSPAVTDAAGSGGSTWHRRPSPMPRSCRRPGRGHP